jgi:hypothetical protein
MLSEFEKLSNKILLGEEKKNKFVKQKGNDIFSITENYLSQKYDLRRNTVSFEVEISPKKQNDWKVANFSDIFVELHKVGITIPEAKLKSLFRSSFIADYNPFLAYFESLPAPPDPQKDYIQELAKHVECPDWDTETDFFIEFRKTLIRCVACSLGDGFNKQCFVLVSPIQNIGKTSFIRFLCPPALKDYYTEEMSFDRDGLIALSTNFIINLDELSVINKDDLNTLKTYFSKDKVKVRLFYEAKASTVKRVCNFFASTNNEDFLNDPTGSVRWVAFYVKKINFDYAQNVDINHVWWQAYQLYKAGERGKMTQQDISKNEERNRQFTKITPEMELILRFFEKDETQNSFLTASEIYEYLMQMSSVKLTHYQIGRALQMLKYTRSSKRLPTKDFPVYGYYIKKVQ